MSKAYFFAIFLLAASFTGCLGDDELDLVETEEEVTEEEEIEEEETITPVGDETGLPVVEFLGLVDEFDSDIYLVAAFYDSDGYIKSYSIEDVVAIDNYGDYCGYGISMGENSTIDAQYNCYPIHSSIFIDLCYDLEHISQTVTVKVEDNDGNTASAEYELMADDFEVCEYHDHEHDSGPMVTLFAQANNGGTWDVTVVQVGEHLDLNDFSFFLKDMTGSTYVGGNGFGEIAMQIVAGEGRGIDASYDGTNDVLQERAADINGDDGTQYPVHFYDNDRDGMLTPGDRFVVHGTGSEANGPAENGWKLDIQYDPTGDVINWVRMEGMPSGGGGSMWDSDTGVWFDVGEDGTAGIWQATVTEVVSYEYLYDFSFFLKDSTGSTYVGGNGFGEIAMQIFDGTEERGIDVSYDGDNVELQSRAGNISSDDGTQYPVHFYDNDGDGKLTPGDYFLIYGTGDSANGPAEDDWRLDIQFDPSGDLVGRANLA